MVLPLILGIKGLKGSLIFGSIFGKTCIFVTLTESLLRHVTPPIGKGIELQASAQRGAGSAGPDNWTAVEVKHLPFSCFDTMSRLFRQFAEQENVPEQFRQGRMVCIPKGNKVHDYAIFGLRTLVPSV